MHRRGHQRARTQKGLSGQLSTYWSQLVSRSFHWRRQFMTLQALVQLAATTKQRLAARLGAELLARRRLRSRRRPPGPGAACARAPAWPTGPAGRWCRYPPRCAAGRRGRPGRSRDAEVEGAGDVGRIRGLGGLAASASSSASREGRRRAARGQGRRRRLAGASFVRVEELRDELVGRLWPGVARQRRCCCISRIDAGLLAGRLSGSS